MAKRVEEDADGGAQSDAGEKIRVAVVGADGRMGQTTVAAIEREDDLELVGQLDRTDDVLARLGELRPTVAVDFTEPAAVASHLKAFLDYGVHPIVGTTGLDPKELRRLQEQASDLKLGGIVAPNFAIGAVLLMQFAAKAASYLPDSHVIEYHHPNKKDAPSGTALLTRELIADAMPAGDVNDIPISSVRLTGFLAHQEVIFGGPGQRLTLRHDSLDRECFMPGVILAIRKVQSLKTLIVGLENLLEL